MRVCLLKPGHAAWSHGGLRVFAAIIVVFDLSSVTSLTHARYSHPLHSATVAMVTNARVCVSVCPFRQWLEDAMKENDPSSVLLFLVGTKRDLSVGETSWASVETDRY